MGIFSFLFKRGDHEEKISNIEETLKSSFSNVKKDIIHVHKTISDHKDTHHDRFQQIEERLKRIELSLLVNQPKKLAKKVVEEEEFEEQEIPNQTANIFQSMPRAELKLFKTLYDIQLTLNAKNISYKSLASYLYPGKEYNSIRSTITQFVIRLHTEGLVEKKRIGKETYVGVSKYGLKMLKKAKIKRILKELEVKE